ncbi:NUDIX hydrolase [Kiloniella sp. b19]|uniref:NUDIX hydrolase n=1 Tax=Kiloniella sp. GXU_MW_B19 TaxID=3141326 RepID=UPI0031D0232F
MKPMDLPVQQGDDLWTEARVRRCLAENWAFERTVPAPLSPDGPFSQAFGWHNQGAASVRSDYDLNPHDPVAPEKELTPAAVLVPIVLRPGGATVLLTQRTAHLHDHPGQVAFPGGRMDPGDRSPVDTALRETLEEIGLSANKIELSRSLDPYVTGTGYHVIPVVGLIPGSLDHERDLTLDAFEVAKAFEVPLYWLLQPENRKQYHTWRNGVERYYFSFPWQGMDIWGATAGMLVDLLDRLRADLPRTEA